MKIKVKILKQNLLDYCICVPDDPPRSYEGYSVCGVPCPVHEQRKGKRITGDVVDGIIRGEEL